MTGALLIQPMLDALSDDAKAVAGGWFGLMNPGGGELTFALVQNKPTARAQAALAELVAAGVISVEQFNRFGGLVYRPLFDCRTALYWLGRNENNPAAKWPLVEPVTGEDDAKDVVRRALAAKERSA